DSPPELPGAQAEYMSAVSIKFPPAAAYASKTANDCFSLAVQPNTYPPSASGKTSRSVELILAIIQATGLSWLVERSRNCGGSGSSALQGYHPVAVRLRRALFPGKIVFNSKFGGLPRRRRES